MLNKANIQHLIFDNNEDNTNIINFISNSKEPEKNVKGTELKNIINNASFNLTNSNNIKNGNNTTVPSNIKKNRIFKVYYRKYHGGNDKDNIKQIIITNFINFFLDFINFIISNIKEIKDIKFKLGYKYKYKLKIEDFSYLNIENLLSKMDNLNNSIINGVKIKKIKERIGNKLNILFNTRITDLFMDIYNKDIQKDTDKKINLINYGLEGLVFEIGKDIPTFQKLKEKYKYNKYKTNLMNDIVYSYFINPTPRKLKLLKLFKTNKKK